MRRWVDPQRMKRERGDGQIVEEIRVSQMEGKGMTEHVEGKGDGG
jgi:hypothetical protein